MNTNDTNMVNDYSCLYVYLKDNTEIPKEQWIAELNADYFIDNGHYPDEDDMDYIGLGDPHISGSGHTYDSDIYYTSKTMQGIIDIIIEDGWSTAINDLLESVKMLPDDVLHKLVGTELHWPRITRKIEYKDNRYIV